MENASKALLIAGAILIVILLIAVGMMVYNGAQGSITKAIGQMSTTERDIHNKNFEPFIGNHVSGTNVRALYTRVIANNSGDDGDNLLVTINGDSDENTLSSAMSQISTSARDSYQVTVDYTDGVITNLNVTQN